MLETTLKFTIKARALFYLR